VFWERFFLRVIVAHIRTMLLREKSFDKFLRKRDFQVISCSHRNCGLRDKESLRRELFNYYCKEKVVAEEIIYTMKGVSKVYPPNRYVLKDIYLSYFYGAKIGI